MSDRIAEYLDQLAADLHRDGARLRRLLTEAETHLRETSERLQRDGLDLDAAEIEALARFGAAAEVASSMRLPTRVLLAEVVRSIWLLVGVGFAAVGLSGVVALIIGLTAGTTFLAGDGFGVTFTAERCAEFFGYFPSAGSCNSAAALHHADEIVSSRVAAGVVAALVLAGYYLRYGRRPGRAQLLGRGTTSAVAAALFGFAGALLTLDGIGTWLGEAAHDETIAGVGGPLSAGMVALLAALLATFMTVRSVARTK